MDIFVWIEALDKARDVHAQWAEIESWLRKGQRDVLIEIARACAQTAPQQWARRSVFDRIVETLALTTSAANVETLTQIFEALPAASPEEHRVTTSRARVFASMLAQEQTAQTLLDLSSWASKGAMPHELFACCVQELVLRGRKVELDDAARAVVKQHELGVLPLELQVCERDFPLLLPRYSKGSMGQSSGTSALGAATGDGARRVITPWQFDRARLQSAVANWEEQSNGVISSGVFGVQPALGVANFGALVLEDLELDATAGIKTTQTASFSFVANALFGAGGGGAYNSGEGGAWSRLNFWRSAGALMGTDETDIKKLSERADKCAWFDFTGQSAWFYNVAWDVGIACLRPDGQSVAAIGATDTD